MLLHRPAVLKAFLGLKARLAAREKNFLRPIDGKGVVCGLSGCLHEKFQGCCWGSKRWMPPNDSSLQGRSCVPPHHTRGVGSQDRKTTAKRPGSMLGEVASQNRLSASGTIDSLHRNVCAVAANADLCSEFPHNRASAMLISRVVPRGVPTTQITRKYYSNGDSSEKGEAANRCLIITCPSARCCRQKRGWVVLPYIAHLSHPSAYWHLPPRRSTSLRRL